MYKITYDFNIIYQKNLNLPVYKILNMDNLNFNKVNLNCDYYNSLIELDSDNIQHIVMNILKGDNIFQLDIKEEDWIYNYENEIIVNNIFYENELCFSVYVFLKMKKFGFDDEFSRSFIFNYLKAIKAGIKIPERNRIIQKLKEIETTKKYLIVDNIDLYKEKEKNFYRKIINSKMNNISYFKIDSIEKDYLNLSKISYVLKNYELNQTNGLNYKDNIKYTLKFFKTTQDTLIKLIIDEMSKDFNMNMLEDTFIVSIIDYQTEIIHSLIKFINDTKSNL